MYNALTQTTDQFLFQNTPYHEIPELKLGWEREVQLFDQEGNPARFEQIQHLVKLFPEVTSEELYAHCIELKLSAPVQTSEQLIRKARSIREQVSKEAFKLGLIMIDSSVLPLDRQVCFNPGEFYQRIVRDIYPTFLPGFRVFGTHLHVNCPSGNLALRVHNRLYRYIWPLFRGLTLNAPFDMGVTTGHASVRQQRRREFILSGDPVQFPESFEELQSLTKSVLGIGVSPSIRIFTGTGPHPRVGTYEVTDCDNSEISDLQSLAEILQLLVALGTQEDLPDWTTPDFWVRWNSMMIDAKGSQANVWWKGNIISYQKAMIDLVETLIEYSPISSRAHLIADVQTMFERKTMGERALISYDQTPDIWEVVKNQTY